MTLDPFLYLHYPVPLYCFLRPSSSPPVGNLPPVSACTLSHIQAFCGPHMLQRSQR